MTVALRDAELEAVRRRGFGVAYRMTRSCTRTAAARSWRPRRPLYGAARVARVLAKARRQADRPGAVRQRVPPRQRPAGAHPAQRGRNAVVGAVRRRCGRPYPHHPDHAQPRQAVPHAAASVSVERGVVTSLPTSPTSRPHRRWRLPFATCTCVSSTSWHRTRASRRRAPHRARDAPVRTAANAAARTAQRQVSWPHWTPH